MNTIAERYVKLVLAVGQHDSAYVDAYYGPPELAARVAAEPARPPAELLSRARRLLRDLAADGDLDAARRRYLAAQVEGLRTTAGKYNRRAIWANQSQSTVG